MHAVFQIKVLRSSSWTARFEHDKIITSKKDEEYAWHEASVFFLNAGATGELLMEHHREMNAGWEMQWTWEMHMNVSWEIKVYSPETQ